MNTTYNLQATWWSRLLRNGEQQFISLLSRSLMGAAYAIPTCFAACPSNFSLKFIILEQLRQDLDRITIMFSCCYFFPFFFILRMQSRPLEKKSNKQKTNAYEITMVRLSFSFHKFLCLFIDKRVYRDWKRVTRAS